MGLLGLGPILTYNVKVNEKMIDSQSDIVKYFAHDPLLQILLGIEKKTETEIDNLLRGAPIKEATPPISEIICDQNVGAIVVCGFLII